MRVLVALSSLEKKYSALYHGTLLRKRSGTQESQGPVFFITGSRQEDEDREAEGPQSREGVGELCPDTELALKGQREK